MDANTRERIGLAEAIPATAGVDMPCNTGGDSGGGECEPVYIECIPKKWLYIIFGLLLILALTLLEKK